MASSGERYVTLTMMIFSLCAKTTLLPAVEAVPRVRVCLESGNGRRTDRTIRRKFEIRKAVAPYPFFYLLFLDIILIDVNADSGRAFSVLRNIREGTLVDERYDVVVALPIPYFTFLECVGIGIAERDAVDGIRVGGRRCRGPLPTART